jgi:hypothetical protein
VVQHFFPYFIQNALVYGALWVYNTSPSRGKPKVQEMEDHIEYQQEVLQLLKEILAIKKYDETSRSTS